MVSSRGNNSVEEYPTEYMDFLSLRRFGINYNDTTTTYYGLNLPGNNVSKALNPSRCYIAMPNNVSTSYQPQYRKVDVGVVGVMAAGMLGTEGANETEIAQQLQSAAGAALPEFAANAIASSSRKLSGALGLESNLDRNALMALTQGRVFNPFSEQIFQNMAFRTHNFNFKMFMRTPQEAQEVKAIIKYIKAGSVPKIGGTSSIAGAGDLDTGSVAGSRFFEVPDKFELAYKRLSMNQNSGTEGIELHHQIKDSVCAGINVNYTPDGSYVAMKNMVEEGMDVPAVTMQLTFIETALVTYKDIVTQEGIGY